MALEVDEATEIESDLHLDENQRSVDDESDAVTEESTSKTTEGHWNKEQVLIWIVNCLKIKVDEDKWKEYEYTGINDIEDDHLGIVGLTCS